MNQIEVVHIFYTCSIFSLKSLGPRLPVVNKKITTTKRHIISIIQHKQKKRKRKVIHIKD